MEPRIAHVAFFVKDDIAWMSAFGALIDDRDLALRRLAPLDVGMRVLDDLACEGNQRESDTLGE